jgi:hypothetical protein
MKDEIIQEVWKAKDAIAERYHHDLAALVKHVRDRERRSSAKVVDLHATRRASLQSVK